MPGSERRRVAGAARRWAGRAVDSAARGRLRSACSDDEHADRRQAAGSAGGRGSGRQRGLRRRQAAASVRRAGAARARAGGRRRARRGRRARPGPGRPRPGAAEADLAAAGSPRRAPAGASARCRLRARDRARVHRQPPLRGAARPRAERSSVDPVSAAEQLTTALALWRGPALAEHRLDEFAQNEIARLEELRLEAIEERIAADLARGQAAELLDELRALVDAHPLRKRMRGQLILALYRTGREADALDVMRQGRRLLVDELGLEPGPELRRLEAMILAHDPELRAQGSGGVLDAPLPTPANTTIGREGELAEIAALLIRPEVRLLTLVGAGGVGKTRLALEASRAVGRPVPRWRRLRRLGGAEGVLVTAAAAALGVVAETPAELGERVARATRGASALLVLDGVERFLADAAQIAEAARRGPPPHDPRDQPRAAAADRRARLPRAAARGLQRRRAVHGSRRRGATRLGARRGRGRRYLRAAGRAAAGDRAGRRPRADAPAAGAARASRAAAGAAELRPARPPRAPAVPARDARVVVGGAGPAAALAARPAQRVRGRRVARGVQCSLRRGRAGRGAAGRGSWTARRWSWSRRARTRIRGWRCSTPCASTPPSTSTISRRSKRATPRTSSTMPSARPRRRRTPTGARGSRGWRASAATCAWRSSACCVRARPRTRCGSRSRSRARCRGTRTSHEVRGWLAQALDGVRPVAEPAARRGTLLGRAARDRAGALRGGRGAAGAGAHGGAGPG